MAQRAADRVSETRRTIMDAIRDNPIPAAMVGIGLGWIYLNARRQGTDGGHRPADGWTAWPQNPRVRYAGEPRPYAGSPRGGAPYEGDTGSGVIDRVRERAADAGESVRETVGGLADRAEDAAREAADRAQDVASSVAHEARDRARRVEDHFHENPLAVGAAALALGVAAGLSLPVTDREVALMGDARDRVVDRAREAARETTEKVEAVAARVADEARETARDAARAQGLTG